MMKKHLRLMLAAICLLAFAAVVTAQSRGDDKVNVSGTWLLKVETPNGTGSPTFTFRQEGEKLSGQYKGAFGEAPVTGKLKGREIEFSIKVEAQGNEMTISYTGTVEGEEMKGAVVARGGGQEFKGTWAGKRQEKAP